MVKLRIIAVGKDKDAWVTEACAHYVKLLKRFAVVEIKTVPSVKRGSSLTASQIMKQEAERLTPELSKGVSIALADSGRKMDTQSFSKWLEKTKDASGGTVQFIIGGAYTHYLRGHISVDTLFNYMSPRWQTITRVAVHFPVFCLYVGVLFWAGTEFAWDSMSGNERSGTLWNPIIWPYKLIVPLGALLVLLQGTAQFVRDVLLLFSGEYPGDDADEEPQEEL